MMFSTQGKQSCKNERPQINTQRLQVAIYKRYTNDTLKGKLILGKKLQLSLKKYATELWLNFPPHLLNVCRYIKQPRDLENHQFNLRLHIYLMLGS